jgi:hypothetical protein
VATTTLGQPQPVLEQGPSHLVSRDQIDHLGSATMMMETKKLFEDLTASINNYIDTMHEGLIKVKAFF